MAQIFVDDGHTSLGIEWFAKYTRADRRHLSVVKLTDWSKEALKIDKVPFMVVKDWDEILKSGSNLGILRFIAESEGFEKIFFGNELIEQF